MKRPVRPLFSFLVFVFLAGTLICRVAISRSSFAFSSAIAELGTAGFLEPPAVGEEEPVFNETLLEFAAIDPGKPKLRKEIDLISDYDDGHRSYHRRFAAESRRYNLHEHNKFSSRLPVTLPSPEIYRYWSEFRRNLQFWAHRKAYEPNIVSELIRLVKNPIDSHNGVSMIASNIRYSSCAVVGNSGILLKTQYGNLIDSHEIVIRLNNARTERFEKNVGSKTSISFINSNILHLCARRRGCYCHPYGETVPIVMYICQPIHFLDYTVCKPYHKSPLIVTDLRFDVLCARIVKYYSVKKFVEETGKSFEEWSRAHDGALFHYSSGMQAVMLALGVCERVSIFGFGKSNSAKHHYHTSQKAELKLHDYEAEYLFYHDLVKNPKAVPFMPDNFKTPNVVIYH